MTEPLRFDRVTIQRMPGFEEGGFTLDGLSPGINIVHGPNASGKTSSTRALEALLWPRAAADQRMLLAGRLRLGDAVWSIDLHGARVHYQRDGVDASAPQLPSEAERDRYRLSLHELLESDNPYFAQQIRTETAGGYDITAAGQALGPRSSASRLKNELEALQAAKAAYDEAVRRQEELRGRERQLVQLLQRLEGARSASARARLLETALEHAAAREKLATAREALGAFPSGMERLRGDEQEQLAKLSARRSAITDEIAAAERKRGEELVAVAVARLPEGGIAPELLRGLRSDLAALRERERRVAAAEEQREKGRRRLDGERARIGGAIDEARVAEVDHDAMAGLAQFARRAADLRRQELELQAAAEVLDREGAAVDLDHHRRVGEGIRLLERWLREHDGGGKGRQRHRLPALIGGAALVVGGVALGLVHPLSLLLALVGAALLSVVLFGAAEYPTHHGAMRRRDYAQLNLEEPSEWALDAVREVLDRLLERRAEAVLTMKRAEDRRALQQRQVALAPRLEALHRERAAITAQLGMDPDIEEGHLCWLGETLSRWQAAHSELTGATGVLETASAEAERLRESLRARLAPFGYDRCDTTGGIEGAVDELAARAEAGAKATSDLARVEEDIARLTAELESCRAESSEIFARVDLDSQEEHTLVEWCQQFQAYRAAADAVRAAEISTASAQRRLCAFDGGGSLLEFDQADLEISHSEARAEAETLESLLTQVTGIREAVKTAKEGHDVESALARISSCEAALLDARERDTRAVVSHVLVEHLRQSTREQHLPAVFHRAKQILSRITHGRYDLRFGGAGEPEFSAYDNTEGRGRRLDQLSSGTRVQLLLAVRVAFIETQERDAKLPIVLDEVLGNSDDERAWAIMEAVIELARDGRQVFYLTAQADEVRKWEAALEGSVGVDSRILDLAETRRIQRVIEVPDSFSVATTPHPRVIDPAGLTHEEYGRALGVPGIDRLHDRAASLHLWYLLEDPRELAGLLRLADRWGAVDGLVRNGGGALVEPSLYQRTAALALAADVFLDEQRVGLGRPVDRLTLEEAEAITDRFIDHIEAISKRMAGDARRLITAMEAREVPGMRGFLTRNTERFREYLEENRYLPREAPLTEEELLSRTLAAAAPAIGTDLISVEEIHRLIGRLRLGCG